MTTNQLCPTTGGWHPPFCLIGAPSPRRGARWGVICTDKEPGGHQYVIRGAVPGETVRILLKRGVRRDAPSRSPLSALLLLPRCRSSTDDHHVR
jgi:hypothetical protein